jgi:hypothetical protein
MQIAIECTALRVKGFLGGRPRSPINTQMVLDAGLDRLLIVLVVTCTRLWQSRDESGRENQVLVTSAGV